MVGKFFKVMGDITTIRPKTVIIIATIFTVIMALFASTLSIELSWVGLAPQGDPSVKEYQDIIDKYPALSNIFIIVEADNSNDLDKIINITESRLSSLEKYVNNVSSKIDTDFLIKKGLLLSDEDNIEAMSLFVSNPNLVDFLKNVNFAFSVEVESLKDKNINELTKNSEYISTSFRGIDNFYNKLNNSINEDKLDIEEGVKTLLVGDNYVRSLDGNKILMTVQPKFDIMDYNLLVPGVNTIISELESIEKELGNVKFEVTGMHIIGRDEMQSVESDSYITMVIGVVIILFAMYFAFKIYFAPILAFIPLLIGVIWDVGLTSLIIGRLNLMTAFTAIMLIGLGIDFSIHILSGYTELRSKGKDNLVAIKITLNEVGPSILTGALTTAAAFLTLTISSLEVLNELGFVMGIGIICTVFAVFLILPSILVFVKSKKVETVKGEYKIIGKIAILSHNNKILVGSLLVIIILTFGYIGSKNEFDLNVINLEPKGLKSVEVMNKLVKEFGMSSEGLLVEKNSLEELYKLSHELKNEELVSKVSSIIDFIPPVEKQEKRLEKIKEIKRYLQYQPQFNEIDKNDLIYEIKKLRDNFNKYSEIYNKTDDLRIKNTINDLIKKDSNINLLIENLESDKISSKDINEIGIKFYEILKRLSYEMMTDNPIKITDIPNNFKSQFTSSNNSYLLTVYPNFEIWDNLDKQKGEDFLNMLREKDKGFTGSPMFMRVLYDSTSDEMTKTGLIVFITLFLIVLMHFKSFKNTVIAFLPLVATMFLTIGTMKLLGLKWNILNVLSLPLIIGIGVDDAVHILHRYNSTDSTIESVFSSVGRAILLTSITTMAGFGSLMFSSYRGMAYLGAILFIGVLYAFITTVLIIPILLKSR